MRILRVAHGPVFALLDKAAPGPRERAMPPNQNNPAGLPIARAPADHFTVTRAHLRLPTCTT
jgi:hypothetical protein